MTKKREPSNVFPDVIWKADMTMVHRALHKLDFYVGSENYALYSSEDGCNLERIYISNLDLYGKTKKEALEKILISLNERIQTIEECLKQENSKGEMSWDHGM